MSCNPCSSGSPPPTPDYAAAANATAAGNLQAAQYATEANRVNQYTPYGSLVYSHDPSKGNGGWSATQSLSPQQQKLLDSTNNLNLGLMNTAGQGLDYANQVLSKPGVDTSKLAQTGFNPGQSYQDAYMQRLQPVIDRENQASDAQLANQGIAPGSQAYINAKQTLNDQHNNLLANVTTQGFNTGLAANQQGFQQQAYNQMQPINVINALRTGSQVQNPTFNNVPQQATTAGADLFGAQQANFNGQMQGYQQQSANNNNFMSGLTQLGATGMMFMSDMNAKQDIEKVGDILGHGVYKFAYKSDPSKKYIGAMAQEVQKIRPDAVIVGDDGFMRVDYNKIPVPFFQIEG
jgi:hypothetical protein